MITVLESINSNLIKISGLIEKVESAQKQERSKLEGIGYTTGRILEKLNVKH